MNVPTSVRQLLRAHSDQSSVFRRIGAHRYSTVRVELQPRDSILQQQPIYIVDDGLKGQYISPWHNIPIRSKGMPDDVVNFICEIPRGGRAKYEISKHEPMNPLVQDTNNDGTLRYYGLKSLVNYGAIPQTYEDPDHKDELTGLCGDGDPLDVVEIGSRVLKTGEVAPIKILGSLAMIDGGEMDWKVLGIRVGDPLSSRLHDIESDSVPADVKVLLENIRHWFRVYKVSEGKGLNSFAFDGKWLGKKDTIRILNSTHGQWKKLVKASLAKKADIASGKAGIYPPGNSLNAILKFSSKKTIFVPDMVVKD